jgi:hypothetical protein
MVVATRGEQASSGKVPSLSAQMQVASEGRRHVAGAACARRGACLSGGSAETRLGYLLTPDSRAPLLALVSLPGRPAELGLFLRIGHERELQILVGEVGPTGLAVSLRCRTVALGGHVARCEDCAHIQIAYNSLYGAITVKLIFNRFHLLVRPPGDHFLVPT